MEKGGLQVAHMVYVERVQAMLILAFENLATIDMQVGSSNLMLIQKCTFRFKKTVLFLYLFSGAASCARGLYVESVQARLILAFENLATIDMQVSFTNMISLQICTAGNMYRKLS